MTQKHNATTSSAEPLVKLPLNIPAPYSRFYNSEKWSALFDNDYFGYTKVVVETPICDESGNPVLKKGKPQADKTKSDTENIPLQEDIDEYIAFLNLDASHALVETGLDLLVTWLYDKASVLVHKAVQSVRSLLGLPILRLQAKRHCHEQQWEKE